MGRIKRNLCIILSLALMICMLDSLSIVKANSETNPKAVIGDFGCEFLSDKTIAIYEYQGYDEEIVIPSELEGYTVSQVGSEDHTSYYNKKVKKVTVSPGIKRITSEFFRSLQNLQEVVMPYSVETIEKKAFYCCDKLESINIPSSVKKIGEDAFNGCDSLKKLVLNEGQLVSIGDSAFEDTPIQGKISFPSSLTTIGDNAFNNCKELSEISFGESLLSVGKNAFRNTILTEISIPLSVSAIGENAFGYRAGLFDEDVKYEGFIIKGVFGSESEQYAKKHGFSFIGTARASMPVFTPEFGTYYEPQTVTLSCSTAGATIYYSVTGSATGDNWIRYTDPISINQTTVLSAYAEAEGCANSAIVSGTFTIKEKTRGQISCKSKFTKYAGDKFNLNAESNTDMWMTYKSSNNKVASVSGEGRVTCKKKGTATITIKLPSSESSTGATKKVKVVVKKKLTVKQAKNLLRKWLKKKGLWQKTNMFDYLGLDDEKRYYFRYYIPSRDPRYTFERYFYHVDPRTGKITDF